MEIPGTPSGRAWHGCQEVRFSWDLKPEHFTSCGVGCEVFLEGDSRKPQDQANPPPKPAGLQNRVFTAYYIPRCSPVLLHLSRAPQTSDFLLFPQQQHADEVAKRSAKSRSSALSSCKSGTELRGCALSAGALLGHLHQASPWRSLGMG